MTPFICDFVDGSVSSAFPATQPFLFLMLRQSAHTSRLIGNLISTDRSNYTNKQLTISRSKTGFLRNYKKRTFEMIIFGTHRSGYLRPSADKDRARNTFPNLGAKCMVGLVVTIEWNRKRSCSTLRIPRMRNSQRCRAIGRQNGKLFRAWS